jgi:leader peptidase (prepilin peptidase) / N-methyltransferase
MITGILISIIVGLVAGLVVNYLADVLPETRKLSRPACQGCQKTIPWIDYILFKPCPACHKRKSLRSIVVVVLMIAAAVLMSFFQPVIGFWLGMLVVAYFGLVIVIDMEHRLVMHPVSIAGAVVGLAFGTFRHGLWMTLLGAAIGFAIMLTIYYLGLAFVRFISKKKGSIEAQEGIGFGDVILSGVLGLFLGFPGIFLGLILAIVLGGVISLFILLFMVAKKEYKAFSAIPYAPFIALAAIILLLLARTV